ITQKIPRPNAILIQLNKTTSIKKGVAIRKLTATISPENIRPKKVLNLEKRAFHK
ncbi:hypothetical protein ANG5_2020, partial [Streptococcus constellatus subsp. pharyngis SK1060 = CCUG 46377]